MRYDNGALSPVLSGVNDRGNSLRRPQPPQLVTLTGPVYAYADARCCAQYRYTRTWTWQGNVLAQSDLAFAPAPEKTVPAWFTSDGPTLVTLLDGFVAQPALGDAITVSYIAPVFADTVTVKDAANMTPAPLQVTPLQQALAQGDHRRRRRALAVGGRVQPRASTGTAAPRRTASTADSCTLDAGANGGYVLHLSQPRQPLRRRHTVSRRRKSATPRPPTPSSFRPCNSGRIYRPNEDTEKAPTQVPFVNCKCVPSCGLERVAMALAHRLHRIYLTPGPFPERKGSVLLQCRGA